MATSPTARPIKVGVYSLEPSARGFIAYTRPWNLRLSGRVSAHRGSDERHRGEEGGDTGAPDAVHGGTAVTVTVRVYGIPVPQARAGRRTIRRPTGQVFTTSYDKPECVDWKRTVVAQVLPVKPASPLEGPLTMTLLFHLPRPKSLPKRVLYPVKKPDAKNLLWGVEDALRGILYVDDSQLVDLDVRKRYGANPGVEITVAPLLADAGAGGVGGEETRTPKDWHQETSLVSTLLKRVRPLWARQELPGTGLREAPGLAAPLQA